MSTLRDLVIGIDFSDIDTKELFQIDSAMDEIESSFDEMGADIDDASREFKAFGASSEQSLSGVEDAIDDVGDETQQLMLQMMMLNMFANDTFDDMEDHIDRTRRRTNILGSAFLATTTKVLGLGSAITLLTAVSIPVMASLVGVVGALGASLGAASAATASYGAVAIGVLTEVFGKAEEVKELEEEIAQADTWQDKIEAQRELKEVYDGMSKSQIAAIEGLQDFKAFWTDFIETFETPILETFTETLEIAEGLLKGLEPTIRATSETVLGLVEGLNQNIKDGGLNEFFDWLEENGADSLEKFAKIGGNVMSGFFGILKAFTPLGKDVESGLEDMTDRFADWAHGLEDSDAFQNFINYVRENGPVLMDTIGNISGIVEELIKDLAPLGSDVLDAIEDVTGAIQDNWPAVRETIIGVGVAAGTFVGIMHTMAFIQVVTGFIKTWRVATLGAAAAQWGLNTAMWANPLGLIVAGIAVLIAAIVLMVRHWDVIKETLWGVWETIKEAWGNVMEATKETWYKVRSVATREINGVIDSINDMIETINNVPGVNVPIVPQIEQPEMPESMAQDQGLSPMALNGSHADGLASVPFDNYKANLHKDEAVLTADQNQTLQDAGVLTSRGDRPQTNITRGSSYKTNQYTYAPQNTYYIQGGGDPEETERRMRKVAKDEQENFWRKMNLKEA